MAKTHGNTPIARGETSGESVARVWRDEAWRRDTAMGRGGYQVTVRFIILGFYVQLSLTYVQSFLSSTTQLNHAERYRSRQGSWRAGTWKGCAWCGSRRQRHSSWWPSTWRRPRSRWWIRTPRTGRVCDLHLLLVPPRIHALSESLQRANPLSSMPGSLNPRRTNWFSHSRPYPCARMLCPHARVMEQKVRILPVFTVSQDLIYFQESLSSCARTTSPSAFPRVLSTNTMLAYPLRTSRIAESGGGFFCSLKTLRIGLQTD